MYQGFFIFLVHGQEVVPVEQNVVGVLRESVKFQWTVDRDNENISILSLILFNGTEVDLSRQLFTLGKQQPVKVTGVTDRLNATILGDFNKNIKVNYTVTLENLKFEDQGTSFLLEAGFRPQGISSVTITLVKVNGTYFLFLVLFDMFSLCNCNIR